MTGFVTVLMRAACSRDAESPSHGGAYASMPGLCVAVRSPGSRIVFSARHGQADCARPPVDEHFVVDSESGQERLWPACADVVTANRARPVGEALRWLDDVRARHPTVTLAAVPLATGGWAVAGGRNDPGVGAAAGGGAQTRSRSVDHRAILLPHIAVPAHPLFPSCVHAWLVAGGTLHGLSNANLIVMVRPAP